MAFNEPEASLHPELMAPLAALMAAAAKKSQIWVVTHSEQFAGMLAHAAGSAPRRVAKINGATEVDVSALRQTATPLSPAALVA